MYQTDILERGRKKVSITRLYNDLLPHVIGWHDNFILQPTKFSATTVNNDHQQMTTVCLQHTSIVT